MVSMDKCKDDQHFVSFNFDSEVLGNVNIPNNVEMHDITLRDGEQQAGITSRRDDKIKIATMLAESVVDRIEAGMPSLSAEDAKVVREISHPALGSKIYAFARSMEQDVDNAIPAGVDGIVMKIPSSDHLIKYAYRWDIEKAVKLSVEVTSYAHGHGLRVTFFINVEIINGNKSGIDTIYYKADKLGIKLDKAEALNLLRKLKNIALARKGPISDEELRVLMDKNQYLSEKICM